VASDDESTGVIDVAAMREMVDETPPTASRPVDDDAPTLYGHVTALTRPVVEDALVTVALPVPVPVPVADASATITRRYPFADDAAMTVARPMPVDDAAMTVARPMPVDDAAMTVARPMPVDDAAMTVARPMPVDDAFATTAFFAPEEPATDEIEAVSDEIEPDEIEDEGSRWVVPDAEISASEIELLEGDDSVEALVSPHGSVTGATPALLLPSEELDGDEERLLLEQERYGELVSLYRQRASESDLTKQKTALLLRTARVYESGLGDGRAAFDAVAEAFELAPDDADVVAEIDRLGKETGRLGELAERIRRKVLPRTADERRGLYLGHLVYWYERVLGRVRDLGPLVADLERHDKVHPVVLKRAAQVAAMNGDVRMQRDHLLRALERTIRGAERATIHLLLGEAFVGTADEARHYELALEADPRSIPALHALKRIAREKERHEQVRWALERLVDVAEANAARVEALLELAELEESKFLRREAAADLLERVLELSPGHAPALKALERCYHALRDWPRLVRVLSLRAERTTDKKTRSELLVLAAEVNESKLANPKGAIEAYRSLLSIDPKSRRALGDLARLYERLGDWTNVATYKARVAELAPTKRAMAQELVKLGDYLDLPERDRIAARLQYERAVVIDPTNVSGWEALQRIAAEAGDVRRIIECLEKRRDHTDVPRQRATVLVELGRVHLERGGHADARKAFEAAIRADPANEPAAAVMLDLFTAESRWAEAAPLAELLVNAAIRDRDSEALFVRLRLATRIAAALGDADRAMLSAASALDARPDDPAAQADLVVIASQCREAAPAALARGRAHLARIALRPEELAPSHLLALARLQRAANDLESAAALFERAQGLLAGDANVTRELADVYLAQGDHARACELKLEVARDAPNAELRFELLCEAGEIWARRAGELEEAAVVFEEARALRPLDPWLLQTLRWLYGELDAFEPLAGVLEQLAPTQEKTSDRVQTLTLLAELVREELHDGPRAVDVYEQILDLDGRKLDLFEEIVRLLTAEKAWERLEEAYRRMLDRVRRDAGPQELEVVLLQQLGIIHRDRRGDAARAYEALDAAAQRRPDDPELRRMIVELLVATDNLEPAIARLRGDVERAPHDASLYAELYELFLRQSAFDDAWCAVDVLGRLRELTSEQQGFLADYAPMPLSDVPGQIVEQAWTSHLLHPELDATLTRLFALITPVVARVRLAQLRPEQRVGRPFTPKHSRMHDLVRATFENAAEILALPTPDLLLGDASGPPVAPALAPYGAVLVNAGAVEAQAGSLAYLVGKCLAEQRPELAARGFFPSVPELTSLVAMALRVARGENAKDPAGAALDQAFAAALDPEEMTALRSVVLGMTPIEATRLDVKAWLRAADLSSTRAGLLVARDVGPAGDAIVAEVAPGPAGELARRDRIGELYKFAVSELYAELRAAIGVAVEA
jgi:tetratricopeptide (TPR) repeat protein